MARRSTPRPAPAPKRQDAARQAAPEDPQGRPKEGHRETVEAIAVAFILALLVRGFDAEAFVIPTGSMAPTLMGRHKEVACPQCGYEYPVNAAEEVEGPAAAEGNAPRVSSGVCVNCRFQARIADQPSFKGDRILVMKFPYDLPFLPGASDPKRWDVVVFRYPEEPEVSYIKRLVGLPGETVRVLSGDIFIKAPGGKDFELAHRPLQHQQAMQMMVYDDAHRAELLKGRPEWQRWIAGPGGGWTEDPASPGTYVLSGDASDWVDLRYRHMVPDPDQWNSIVSGDPLPREPRSTLITDFYSYNTNRQGRGNSPGDLVHDTEGGWMQPHWVGDLTVSGTVTTESATGSLRFELIEGGTTNRCEIDLATGQAVLWHGETELGRTECRLKGKGRHDFTFANVDNRLTFWVDGTAIFGEGKIYGDPDPARPKPTVEDLRPVRFAARGAKVRLSGLVLKRNIYYTQNPGSIDYSGIGDTPLPRTAAELFDLLADPPRVASFGTFGPRDFELGSDRFLMLGDNSPRSKDSRGWRNDDIEWDTTGRQSHEVPRALITGKAFCVYWPHGKPFGPDIRLGPDLRIPFRPYFERMGWIR